SARVRTFSGPAAAATYSPALHAALPIYTGSSASYSWTVDTAAPSASITAQPANPTNATGASLSFTGSDNVTPAGSLSFQCSLDGGAFAACTSPKSYSGLADGAHSFDVKATRAEER